MVNKAARMSAEQSVAWPREKEKRRAPGGRQWEKKRKAEMWGAAGRNAADAHVCFSGVHHLAHATGPAGRRAARLD